MKNKYQHVFCFPISTLLLISGCFLPPVTLFEAREIKHEKPRNQIYPLSWQHCVTCLKLFPHP